MDFFYRAHDAFTFGIFQNLTYHLSIPLCVSSYLLLTAVSTIFDTENTIKKLGFSEPTASSKEAQTVATYASARTIAFSCVICTFLMQGKLESVDTMLVIWGTCVGLVDALVQFREGKSIGVIHRLIIGGLYIAWGLDGRTAKGRGLNSKF
ncbi:hypothetical protein BU24DRAFT_167500 [Aaosphaeria arxii CBS 175.79]|uniref:Uncharacterized protein n=1 Tax=Aaosphaeria arxii CBS 175.79 TaxID=1450172 RepID=A0A6A5XY27_9PLEO|nr:uncharacterized protein BU24DRAFT_167500 [Aaosphaeria arxii CBS 175.79]KAF2018225.1 hypothetical protein BU24DRAFT_167500 [Aaosphaeria arxii CBS 175.79]